MKMPLSYRNALFAALGLHFLLAIMLFSEASSEHPVLVASKDPTPGQSQPLAIEPQEQAIKAVSVDSKEVMKTVNRLKEERLQQQRAEQNRQRMLAQQAELARKQRIEEQQHIEQLKMEAIKLAQLREKKLVEEKNRLDQLAKQKIIEEKHLAQMKQQQIQLKKLQQQEAEKLAELKKKKIAEQARAMKETQEKIKREQARQEHERQEHAQDELAKAKEALAKKQQAAAQQAAMNAENTARMAGEVDKYKALIIGAISRQWILPENASSQMSSQFRIRLAPNGAVLEVSLIRSSGDPVLDRSAQSAIYKASPLPVPSDPQTFDVFRDISLTVRPENARG